MFGIKPCRAGSIFSLPSLIHILILHTEVIEYYCWDVNSLLCFLHFSTLFSYHWKKVCQIHKNQGNTSTFVASFVLFVARASSCGHLVNRLCRCSKYAENIICFQIMTHYPPVKICKYTLMSLNINATDKYHWLIVPLQQNVLLGNFRSWHVMWLVQIALTYVTVNTTEHWW